MSVLEQRLRDYIAEISHVVGELESDDSTLDAVKRVVAERDAAKTHAAIVDELLAAAQAELEVLRLVAGTVKR